jgi:hypothetical protein
MSKALEAAKAAVDLLMEHAAALVNRGSDGEIDPDAMPQVDLVIAQARTARAALEVALAEPGHAVERDAKGQVTGYGYSDPEVHEIATKAEGGAMRMVQPSKASDGPKDEPQAPGFFKQALGAAPGQIHPVANFPHCELCGRRFDKPLEDPCKWHDCPHQPPPKDAA